MIENNRKLNLKAEKKRAITEEIVEHIKDLFLSKNLKPGDRLLPERELAEQFGVSRPSIREALVSLSNYGILRIEPGQGAFVVEPNMKILSDFFGLALSLKPSIKESIDEVRIVLECESVRLAAERRTEDELSMMESVLQEMPRTTISGDLGARKDYEFHNLIIQATHNEPLIFIYEAIADLLMQCHYKRRAMVFEKQGALELLAKAHGEILESIREQNPSKAEKRMRDHFRIIEIAFNNQD